MKLVYTGRKAEFPPNQARKLDAKLALISKLLGHSDKEGRVVLTRERFQHQAEITVNVWDHRVVALGADGDLFAAVSSAVDNLEKQLAKMRTKWRDTKRHKDSIRQPEAEAAVNGASAKTAPPKAAKKAAAPAKRRAPKVFRVGQTQTPDYRVKPMTVDEAMLEIDAGEDYLVFEEATTGKRNVLVRRKDGDFDLVES